MLVGNKLIEKLSDPDKFEIFDEVAILDEHDIEDEDGRKIGYADEKLLKKIADNNNKLIDETGDACPVVIGHTKDANKLGEKPDEQEQPEIVGYATKFSVGTMPNRKKAIFARFHIYKDRADDVERYYPRRSVELWTHGHWEINPISLLGATAPERNLGLMIRKERVGQNVIRYQKSPRFYYNDQTNRIEPLKPVRIHPTFTSELGLQSRRSNQGATKMARVLNPEDQYNSETDDLTDFDHKLMNTILKVLEKSPMWKFYKDQEKQQKQQAEMEAESQMAPPGGMPPDAQMGQGQPPMPQEPGQAPPQDQQAMANPGEQAMAGPNQDQPLTREEAQELMALLSNPSQSPVAGLLPGQGGPLPPAQPVRNARKDKCEDGKSKVSTAIPAGTIAEAGEDGEEESTDMKRHGKMSKMSSHAKPPKKYEMPEEEEEPEEEPDFNGAVDETGDEPVDDYEGDEESYGDDDDDGDMEEWHDDDESPEDPMMGEDDEEEMPVKKQMGGSMPSATNGFVPGASKRPSEAGSTRNPVRKAEMKVKTKADLRKHSRSSSEKLSKLNNAAHLLAKVDKLERLVERLAKENEAIRTKERYARRENQIITLLNDGYEVEDPRELFEEYKDEKDEVFEKQIKTIKKYARKNQDISRVDFFNTQAEQSVFDGHRDLDFKDSQAIGDIMREQNCDFNKAKQLYFKKG